MNPGFRSVFPGFQPEDIFTDIRWERFQRYARARGCNPIAVELLTGVQLVNDNWTESPYIQ